MLIAILIIDETDNCEFFLYKYKISNEDKKRIMFIKIYMINLEKDFFSKNNLQKIFIFDGKILLARCNNFSII